MIDEEYIKYWKESNINLDIYKLSLPSALCDLAVEEAFFELESKIREIKTHYPEKEYSLLVSGENIGIALAIQQKMSQKLKLENIHIDRNLSQDAWVLISNSYNIMIYSSGI